jgi:hypothetical protein
MTERATVVVARLVVSLVTASLLAACSSDASPSASASGGASSPAPSAVATASPAAGTPTPTAAPTATWTKPILISSAQCSSLRGGIDAAGGSHVIAACDTGILYASTKADGAWGRTVFPAAENRVEVAPQIGFEGKVAYVAYSRLAVVEGGCGDDGLTEVGVFYRKRTLPSGEWSDPVRIGKTDDQLAQFRVDGTALHAVVANTGDSRFYYLLVKGTTSKRVAMPSAWETASLRIGSDGRARIAYGAPGSIGIATFTGSGFATAKVPAVNGRGPILILDAKDRAHVIWTRFSPGTQGGDTCGYGGEDVTLTGTYYGTNANGTWHSERVTRDIGESSFQVDRSTGRVHLVMATSSGMTYYTKPSGGTWQQEKLAPRHATFPVIARDSATGRVLIMYIDYGEDTSGVYAISKGG